jgi:hypothetical protein
MMVTIHTATVAVCVTTDIAAKVTGMAMIDPRAHTTALASSCWQQDWELPP